MAAPETEGKVRQTRWLTLEQIDRAIAFEGRPFRSKLLDMLDIPGSVIDDDMKDHLRETLLRMFRKDIVGYSTEQLPPSGVKHPMCWCGDECCFQTSDDWDTYSQSPEKPKPVPKGKKGKAKMPVKAPEVSPPLCDFVEWIDKEMDEFHSGIIRQWRERKE
uniref:Uncharacterized protein n=1 Tax=Oryza punctata TaxID=4537 RepID=A0A0E0KIC4_ORYPU